MRKPPAWSSPFASSEAPWLPSLEQLSALHRNRTPGRHSSSGPPGMDQRQANRAAPPLPREHRQGKGDILDHPGCVIVQHRRNSRREAGIHKPTASEAQPSCPATGNPPSPKFRKQPAAPKPHPPMSPRSGTHPALFQPLRASSPEHPSELDPTIPFYPWTDNLQATMTTSISS